MKAAIYQIPQTHLLPLDCAPAKLRAIVVDPSRDAIDVVCDLLEFHHLMDLVGRAANADEALGLAFSLKPDLILLDVAMPHAHALVAAIMLSNDLPDVKIVALSAEDSVPASMVSLILDVSALVHKTKLKQEFPSVFHALFEGTQSRRKSLSPYPEQ
jgi:DNA-binding NarL/FixJ family response regulator